MRKLLLLASLTLVVLGITWGVLILGLSSSHVEAWGASSLPLTFDFEDGLQGWHIRESGGDVYGVLGSARTVAAVCPQCLGTSAFEFQVDLRNSPENRGQVAYLFPASSELPTTAMFTAWLWIPEDAPRGLEAEFFVQSGEEGSHWTASRPRQSLQPGEWTLVTGKGTWSGGAWINPVCLMGIEVKAKDGWPVPVGAFPVRIDQVRVMAADQAVYLPLILRNYTAPTAPKVVWDYRGASLAGYWEHAYAPQGNAYEMVDQLKATGVNAVTILATWYQDGFTTTEIITQPMTPRNEDIAALVDYAHQQGMQVALKPHIDPLVGWRAEISPTNAISWFHNFKHDFLLPYAELAEAHDVEMLVIGAEYQNLVSPTHIDHWADVIASVRQVYNGKVVYAATEPMLFSDVIPAWFWESLDMVSLTFYHEFSRSQTPAVAEVLDSWEEDAVVDDLEVFHQRYNLPVLLAEVGYRSIDYAGFQTFRTEGPNAGDGVNPEQSIAYNGTGQANMYAGLFQALGDKEWIAGAFLWQFVPRGGCAGTIRGGIGNSDYTILGKPAALVVHDWFGGPVQPPPQWQANPTNPWVDTFEYWAPEYVPAAWQVTTSGEVTFTVDTGRYPTETVTSRSIIANTHVPVENGRFQQLDYFFCDGERDWRDYQSIELWVRPDMQPGEPEGCELAIGLIEGSSQSREYWQSSQVLERYPADISNDGWRKVQISLTGAEPAVDDPWRHPTDFVIPPWETPINCTLELTAVIGVRIKTLTTDENPAYPDCQVWLGPLRASSETVEIIPPPNPPLLDAFEYQSAETAEQVWKQPRTLPGTVTYTMDTSRAAPADGSSRSLHIQTYTPCSNPRFEEITNFFLGGGVDLSGYESLQLWAGGTLVEASPDGGEFSIIIEDKDGERWQSTRWLNQTIQGAEYKPYGLEPVRVSLTSFVTDPSANPWYHPADFVLLYDGPVGNKVLDRDWIRSVTLKTLTTNEYCAEYPQYDVWVDHLTASTAPVFPPELVAPPVIDRFEYADKETARLIWKWLSSGQMNVSMDSNVHAPGSSTHSMHIYSNVPAGDARYGQAFNVFLPGTQDLSAYSRLRFWARTKNVAPWGGEVSIELVETDPNTGNQEVWRNTRWFGDSEGAWIEINLQAGSSVPADPWDPAYSDVFVVPRAEVFVDGVFDLTRITEIRVIPLTTRGAAQDGHTEFELWLDEMTVE